MQKSHEFLKPTYTNASNPGFAAKIGAYSIHRGPQELARIYLIDRY